MPFRPLLNYYAERTDWACLAPYGEFKELESSGQLLLGCEGYIKQGKPVLDPERPVYIPFDTDTNNPPSFMILGKKGMGKTTLETNLIHQWWRAYDCYVFVIDPKAHIQTHSQPQTNPAYINFLNKIRIAPAGLPLKVITPAFLKSPKYENTDIWYALGMKDFNSITELSIRNGMLDTILGLSGADAPTRKLQELLARNPTSFNEMLQHMNELNARSVYYRKMKVFDINLEHRLRTQVIAEDMSVNVPDLMMHNIVVLQVSLAQDTTSSAYAAFALAQIKDAFEAGKFKGRKVVLAIDEADVLIPPGNANPPSKPLVTQMFTKWRSEGAIPCLLTQDPSNIADTVKLQTDYIMTPRITYNQSDYRLISSLYPDTVMTGKLGELTDLFSGKNDVYPKEWAVIGPDQEVQRFFPIYSPSQADRPQLVA